MNAANWAKRSLVPAGLAVTVAVALALAPASLAQNAALEPQSLVGQWFGTWTEKSESKVNGPYYLTIDKVDGNKVFGRAEIHSLGRGKNEFNSWGLFKATA